MIKKNNKYKKIFFLLFSFSFYAGMAADDADQGFQVVRRGGRVSPEMQLLFGTLVGDDVGYLSQNDYKRLLKWHKMRRTQNEFLDDALDDAAEKAALLKIASDLSARHSPRRRRYHSFSGDGTRSSNSPSAASRIDNTPAEEGAMAHDITRAHGNHDGGYLTLLPLELIDRIVILGGIETAARLAVTCRGFYARYGGFLSLMTRAQRPLPILEDMSVDMRWLWRTILTRTQVLNFRGGWLVPGQAHDFWNAFIDQNQGVPVARLDLSVNRMSYSVIANGLGRLCDGPNCLSELVLDDVRFGTRDLGNFDIEFDAFCTQIAGIRSLKRLSLRRCGLSNRHLDVLMDSLLGFQKLTLDLKGNYIRTLYHPQQYIVDAMALVVEELNLGNNPFNVGSLAPLLRRHRTGLQRLYVRDVGAQTLGGHLSFLEALLNSRLTALDVRDNPDMNSGNFIYSLLKHALMLDTLATGMTGGQARPRLPLFDEATEDTMGPKSRLRTLTFGQDLSDEDVDHFMSFSGNKRHLRHIVLEGAISPKSVGRFFEMQLLTEMDLQNPQGFTEEDWHTLAEQAWQHPAFNTMDLRSVPEGEHASLVHFVTRLTDTADSTHKEQQARARKEIEDIRPQCRHGKQYTNLKIKANAPFKPKSFYVRLPHNMAQAFNGKSPDWLTLNFESRTEDSY